MHIVPCMSVRFGTTALLSQDLRLKSQCYRGKGAVQLSKLKRHGSMATASMHSQGSMLCPLHARPIVTLLLSRVAACTTQAPVCS
jgi:hypothetical protein